MLNELDSYLMTNSYLKFGIMGDNRLAQHDTVLYEYASTNSTMFYVPYFEYQYLRKYIHTYIRTDVLTYLNTFIGSYVHNITRKLYQ